MDADPHAVLLVGEQVDVVVAGADGAELAGGQVAQLALGREGGVADLVDDGVVAGAAVVAPDAEGDAPEDLVHDPRQVGLHVAEREVGEHRLVAAADVVADARRAEVLAVGDDAADRLRVADVTVGAQHALAAVLRLDAALELRDGPLVVVAEDPHRPPTRVAATSGTPGRYTR